MLESLWGPRIERKHPYQIQKVKLVLSGGSTERWGDVQGSGSCVEKSRFPVKAAFKVWSLCPKT